MGERQNTGWSTLTWKGTCNSVIEKMGRKEREREREREEGGHNFYRKLYLSQTCDFGYLLLQRQFTLHHTYMYVHMINALALLQGHRAL